MHNIDNVKIKIMLSSVRKHYTESKCVSHVCRFRVVTQMKTESLTFIVTLSSNIHLHELQIRHSCSYSC